MKHFWVGMKLHTLWSFVGEKMNVYLLGLSEYY